MREKHDNTLDPGIVHAGQLLQLLLPTDQSKNTYAAYPSASL
jgi:hypothetical protein